MAIRCQPSAEKTVLRSFVPVIDKYKTVLSECLEAAAEIQRGYFARIADFEITKKGRDFNLQTVADLESERAIVERIQAAFPDHSILTEEAGKLDRPGASVRWIIDPLDGTLNYRHGLPHCAISIAVEVDGEPRLGAVYNAMTGERFEAERGAGATLNGTPIRVSSAGTLGENIVVAGFPYDRRERIDHYVGLFRTFMLEAQAVHRMGSAAMDLCGVACGRFGAYYEENIEPWDWAAGVLIVEEAGGNVTDYHGENRFAERRQFCASNGLIHEEMIAVLKPSVTGDRTIR